MAANVSYISTYDGDLTDAQLRAEAVPVVSSTGDNLLIEMLTALRKIEYHLAIATDTILNDQDV